MARRPVLLPFLCAAALPGAALEEWRCWREEGIRRRRHEAKRHH